MAVGSRPRTKRRLRLMATIGAVPLTPQVRFGTGEQAPALAREGTLRLAHDAEREGVQLMATEREAMGRIVRGPRSACWRSRILMEIGIAKPKLVGSAGVERNAAADRT